MSVTTDPTAALVERLEAAIAARPKYAALPIDTPDVHAIVAALKERITPNEDAARLDHVESLLREAEGTHAIRVTNEASTRRADRMPTSYYLNRYGPSDASLRDVIDADRERLATVEAHRAKPSHQRRTA